MGQLSRRRVFGFRIVPVIAGAVLCSCFRAPYEADPDLYNLRCTEIHYNPAADTVFPSDSLEFIELKNAGSVTLELKSLEFTGGIDYSFPIDAVLPPGGFYLIASSENGFRHRYGFAPDGVFRKRLGNRADTIVLTDELTYRMIFSQPYADSGGWPVECDGDGYSLVPKDPQGGGNTADPDAWRASAHINGSPGADDPGIVLVN